MRATATHFMAKKLSIIISLFLFFIPSLVAEEQDKKDEEKKHVFLIFNVNGDIELTLTGSKTAPSKLKRIVTSEKTLISAKDFKTAIINIQAAYYNTGLFDQVTIVSVNENKVHIHLKDTYTLLPIVNFSTNLENFSYTVGINESDLFNNMIAVGGTYSESKVSNSVSWWLSANAPFEGMQSIGTYGLHGDVFFYSEKKWYRFDHDDIGLTFNWKAIQNDHRIFYGFQLRYTDFEFKDDPIFSAAAHLSFGKFNRNHDISDGYRITLSLRLIDEENNKFTFSSNFKKSYFINLKNSSVFRGINLNFEADYSIVDEPRSAISVFFSNRNGNMHGLRSNSLFDRYFLNFNSRFGITSKKFLWTYWQPHVFAEVGITSEDTYYSVGGGLLLTFTPLFNSRLRIQYYHAELPDKITGLIISTSLDF